jgi:hypothetical protein
MSYQNINQYNFNKIGFRPVNEIIDITLASDELNYDTETVFSAKLIAEDDGNRMPFNFDFDYSGNSSGYSSTDVIVSKNYYNPNKENLLINQKIYSLCDVGLTGIDNGLTQSITGETLEFNTGLYTQSADTYNRLKFDRRLKLHPITGFTTNTNRIYNDNSYSYNIASGTTSSGKYSSLNGSFYQGFYRLFGYDYEIFPERVDLGWTAEFILKYRWTGDTNGLNIRYPKNKGTFFYLGARAENKFYHFADGHPMSYSAYTRPTSGLTCLDTCNCNPTYSASTYSASTYSASTCNKVYPITGVTNYDKDVIFTEPNPLYDSVSNALSIQLSGDSGNPIVCVKTYTLTGTCETSGATINQWCSTKGIFDEFKNTSYILNENWVQIDAVFVRDRLIENCDLKELGGLGLLISSQYTATTADRSVELIQPKLSGETNASIEVVNFDQSWINTKNYRNGNLRIYINGKIFFIIDNFEEIIPRPLNTLKERQIGVPFNISIGGGTQGLKDSLTLSSCTDNEEIQILTTNNNNLIQDPELLPTDILNNTSYSGLTTNIILEEEFGGSLVGDLSAFRMYVEPLNAGQVRHNFKILKTRYGLIDPFNPDKAPVVVLTGTITITV